MTKKQQQEKLERQANRILAKYPNPPRFLQQASKAGRRRKRNFACYLRHHQTEAEKALYRALCKSGIPYHWHCQRLMLGWIVDFWCHHLKMIIEVDGGYHNDPAQAERDAHRDRILSSHGILVVRVSNEEIEHSVAAVIERLSAIVKKRKDEIKRRPESFPNQIIRRDFKP